MAAWRQLWVVVAIFNTIYTGPSTGTLQGDIPYYRQRVNALRHGMVAATTDISWAVNPVLPNLGDSTEESQPSTTTSAPADTLHSPFQDNFSVTPSISSLSSSRAIRASSYSKAIVRPYRRRLQYRNQNLLPGRHQTHRGSWREEVAEERNLQRWPLQALQEEDNPSEYTSNDGGDNTLRWWVTNEPQLTLKAPETTLDQRPFHFQRLPSRTTHITTWGTPARGPSLFQNRLNLEPTKETLTPRQTRPTTPTSKPTRHPPYPSPTTLAEDPAVLQTPQDLMTTDEIRQPRWFPLDRLFRMITVGADGECVGEGGRLGVCMLEGACRNAGGTPSTSCAFGYGNCCIDYKAACGVDVRLNRTYWASPTNDPVTTTGGSCVLRVFKLSSNICHIRLDMRRFTLVGPQEGSCLRDRLVVSGHNINAFIPKICGENAGQHMYIDVDTVSGPIELNVNTVGAGLSRSWEIEVSQIACNSAQRPPANCLQYFLGAQGTFSSFNYLPNSNSQYLNNQNYAICLRKEAGFCSIVYSNTINQNQQDFQIVNFNNGPSPISVTPVGEAGVGLIQCPNDYLVMASTRLCGERLNDGSSIPQATENGPVTDSTNGPFTVQFTTDTQNTGKGFRLQYQQYPC